ncbi:MAG: HD domain-containing protein [Methanobacterium sp.]|uniref:HD domain-containing protein n=1 Tax=Methanobacterium sp. TaxID=2164 RepID=UPI003D650640|nr:HD domain-containing protein [Methanobacterium sp.]
MKNYIIQKMIEYFQNDVKRINHALKVFNFAQIISYDLSLEEKTKEIIIYAAILHDIGIKEAEKKYDSSIGKYQEIEGPPIAREMLSDLKISEEIINRVCTIIGNHHSYTKMKGIDFQVVVEADFLVNIFEENMGKNAIKNIENRIFKTGTGKKLIMTMYLNEN